ncbi:MULTISPECIES: FKBP-type peptidyl-prolyl cis-trans isomerase [Streptomyces]|uniref:FKBP-type peptidyl-prolyl cis-trans isomerase n=1 Tax=Streptomyces TaxID=1883 RepID=UPI000CD4CD5A|nr:MULTISPECIES: FKBP-type peptidyl-prolyl cis-trans isomerase [Streptomyces]
MIPTKTAHRLAAVLAVPALLLVSACGSDDGDSSGSDAAAATTVSGEIGSPPEIEVDPEAEFDAETKVTVISEGDGEEVASGDYFRADVVGMTVADEAELINTWVKPEIPGQEAEADEDAPRSQYVARTGEEGMLPQAIVDSVVGQKVGSRVLIEGQAGTLIGPQVAQAGMNEEDGLVWVFDIVGAAEIDPQGEAEGEQAEPAEGMPEVVAGEGKAAEVTVPEGEDPPSELREQVLVEGDGAEVEAGEGLVVQYTGVDWAEGEQFDASWDREAASAFQIGTGSVVTGWDEALVGKNVGDRVLLVLPPEKAYGAADGHELQESTLIFVVDILGVV